MKKKKKREEEKKENILNAKLIIVYKIKSVRKIQNNLIIYLKVINILKIYLKVNNKL